MILIRKSRTRTYRGTKHKQTFIIFQVAVLNCSIFVSSMYVSTPTNASFIDVETARTHIQAGVWEVDDDSDWDKSSLEFLNSGTKEEPSLMIYAVIGNGEDSGSMEGPVSYEVYYSPEGNPKNGEIKYTGEISPLKIGEEATLEFTPAQSGNYKFKAYQRTGHPGTGELWSETIVINLTDASEETVTTNSVESESLTELEESESKSQEDNKNKENASVPKNSSEEDGNSGEQSKNEVDTQKDNADDQVKGQEPTKKKSKQKEQPQKASTSEEDKKDTKDKKQTMETKGDKTETNGEAEQASTPTSKYPKEKQETSLENKEEVTEATKKTSSKNSKESNGK
ncbi:hypothetical protein N780_09475 [Pontibacillus chungwhensis BH030062]|uniref:Amyloid fiber anchoring/assembly protein TapA n=1 Tax=Pontibacillus chungwhensis BH030062 TaxID=1385513 RepID=A0A0A2UPN1_9BACI|nr:amyloid fiber anchoring/assembly protein TapA [Pontibacillus chungwhensis]KGP89869.1 hypothetical protein N780_09475 [Pontibacillus chungwhensis BH030062]